MSGRRGKRAVIRTEVDPLLCPNCGGAMKIIAFIEKRDQADVIERILKHCSL